MVKLWTRGLGFLAVAMTGLLVFSPEAVAEDEVIHTQPYIDTLGIPYLHEQGLTGKGVTIAVIDSHIDSEAPELAGTDLTVYDRCPLESAVEDPLYHATSVVSILAADEYGIAPDAKINLYSITTHSQDVPSDECVANGGLDNEQAINQAITDGADIISISLIGAITPTYPLIRAAEKGIPVVVGVGNNSSKDPLDTWATKNTTVGVGATDLNGTPSHYSNFGASVAVCAPGMVTSRSYEPIRELFDTEGTSVSTPIVAGLLAVAKQKWPNATGNQLIRLLLETATRNDGKERDDLCGFGLVSPQGLITTDPTTFEDTNPLWDKGRPDWHPTLAEYSDYVDGLVDPMVVNVKNDPDYIYRGTNEAVLELYPDITRLGTSPRFHRSESGASPSVAPSPSQSGAS